MANETTEILRIVFEADEAIKKTADLKKQRDQLKQTNRELQQSEGDNSVAIEKNTAVIKALDQTIRNNEKQTQLLIKANTAAAGSYEQLLREQQLAEIELKNTANLLERNADGTIRFTQAYFDASKRVDDAKQAILLFNGGISQGAQNVGNYGNTLQGLRQRLSDLQKEIQTTDVGSQRFRDASDEAANLGLQIGQLEGKIDEFGNKEPKNPAKRAFEDTIATAGALTSSIQLINVAFDEGSPAAETLAKSVQAIAVAQNVANIVKEKGAIIDTLTLKNFRALGATQATYGVIVGTSTGALKLFRLALAATGVGALVVGLGLLLTNFNAVKDAVLGLIQPFTDFLGLTSEQEREAAAVTAEYEKQLSTVERLQRAEEIRFDIVLGGLNRQLKIAKSLGKDTNAIEKQIAAERQKSLKEQERLTNEAIKNLLAIGLNTTEAATKYADLQKVLRETREEILDTAADETARLNYRTLAIQKQTEAIRKLREAGSRPLAELETRQITTFDTSGRDARLQAEQDAILNKQLETNQKILENDRSALEKRLDLAQEFETATGISTEAIFAEYQRRKDDLHGVSLEKFLAIKQQELDAQIRLNEQLTALTLDFGNNLGDIFADTLGKQGADIEDFQKRFVTLLLDTLQKQVQLSVAGAISREIGSKGLPGIITGALAAAAIQAAFSIAKSRIAGPSKFADGVIGLNGPGNERSDSIPAYLSRGESVITASGTRFAQAAYPGLLEFLNTRNRFADGVVNFGQVSTTASPDIAGQIRAALSDLQIVTRVTDIEKATRDRRQVRTVGVI
jgi:hypothetical protein